MTPEGFDKEVALLVEEARSWTNETAPQTLDEFPLLPQSLLSLFEDLQNARSEIEITDTTLTWTTDLPARMAGSLPDYMTVTAWGRQFDYVDTQTANVVSSFLESVSDQRYTYTVKLPEETMEKALSDAADPAVLLTMYTSLNEWDERLMAMDRIQRPDDELFVLLDINNGEYGVIWRLSSNFSISIYSCSSGQIRALLYAESGQFIYCSE